VNPKNEPSNKDDDDLSDVEASDMENDEHIDEPSDLEVTTVEDAVRLVMVGVRLSQLDEYLRTRSRAKGLTYDLDAVEIFCLFGQGRREFSGVKVCEHGSMIGDSRQPHHGYLDQWKAARQPRDGAAPPQPAHRHRTRGVRRGGSRRVGSRRDRRRN